MNMRFFDITSCDVNNGEGVRVTLWVAGCAHHCQGCQNPHTWDFKGGRPFDKNAHDYLMSELAKPYIDGLTLSGGDPMYSLDDIVALSKEIKEKIPDKNIWLYTGFTFEEIQSSGMKKILPYVDVIVDGTYVEALRDVTLAFRGSSNQRVVRLKNGQELNGGKEKGTSTKK